MMRLVFLVGWKERLPEADLKLVGATSAKAFTEEGVTLEC